MVVAVVQEAGRPVKTRSDLLEDGPERLALNRRERSPCALFQAPLDEVLELPQEQPLVKALLKSDTGGSPTARAVNLQEHELIDRSPVQALDLHRRQLLRGLAQEHVTNIFEQQKPVFLPIVI